MCWTLHADLAVGQIRRVIDVGPRIRIVNSLVDLRESFCVTFKIVNGYRVVPTAVTADDRGSLLAARASVSILAEWLPVIEVTSRARADYDDVGG